MSRHKRFDSQLAILLAALQANREWRTLHQLSMVTGISLISLSSQLRNLRKKQHGGHAVAKRRLNGIYEYKLGE